MSIKTNCQSGAVSLFVVVFTALLITVVTVSFVRIMIHDQQQATVTDLSQSAYDSALAGVEDAKRALIRYQNICDTSGNDAACLAAETQVESDECNVGLGEVVNTTGSEVKIETGGDNALDQAYTCVKVTLDTVDYIGSLSKDESNIIPLSSVDEFNAIQLEWYNSDDISSNLNFDVNLQSTASTSWPLLAQTSWAVNRPPVMRTQMMQFGSNGFTLSDFDDTNASSESNANTLFLYPSGTTGTANPSVTADGNPDERSFVSRDIRKTPTGAPLPIACSGDLTTGGYACTARLVLPTPINGGDRTAYLRLSALYNSTNYRVTLFNEDTSVLFKAVQPEVDSTGRTNDLFRRVSTRVEMTDINFPYPEAAVDISDNLCKDFRVTDDTDDYLNNCTP